MRPVFDLRVAGLAARQHGVVAHRQLVALGLGPRGVAHRVAGGRLHVIHEGVYAVGHAVLRREGWWMAAVLACGPGAALSHRDAAALWGIRRSGGARVDVVVATQDGRARPGIAVHRCAKLAPDAEVTERDGIPVTTPARTLLDLARCLRPDGLVRAVEQAHVERLYNHAAVEAVVARHRGRAGTRRLHLAAEAVGDGPAWTRSELERRFLDVCAAAGLPAPQVNVLVEGFEVDFCWPQARLIVEADSRYHDNGAAFERDRLRDQVLTVAGWRVLRVTARQLRDEPEAVAARIRALLGPARPAAALPPAGPPAW